MSTIINHREIIQNHKQQSQNQIPKQYGTTSMIVLDRESQEYKNIASIFIGTKSASEINVISISRIKNEYFNEMYDNQLKCVTKKNNNDGNERVLFHGTSMAAASEIIKQGFDDRWSDAKFWGEGTYYAVEAKKSQDYCKSSPGDLTRIMPLLVNKVMVGDSCVGFKDGKTKYKSAGIIYDSFTDDQKPCTEVVTMKSFQAVPLYIIYWNYATEKMEEKKDNAPLTSGTNTNKKVLSYQIEKESEIKYDPTQVVEAKSIKADKKVMENKRMHMYSRMGIGASSTNNNNNNKNNSHINQPGNNTNSINKKKRNAVASGLKNNTKQVKRRKLNAVITDEYKNENDNVLVNGRYACWWCVGLSWSHKSYLKAHCKKVHNGKGFKDRKPGGQSDMTYANGNRNKYKKFKK